MLFIHLTSFTQKKKMMKNMVYFIYIAYIPLHSSYMREYMYKKCHVWSIAVYSLFSDQVNPVVGSVHLHHDPRLPYGSHQPILVQ